MTVLRVRVDLAYDGTDFSGWARQPGRRTVEGELTGALTRVLRRDDVRLTVAGRTDAGVHARGGVCHGDIDADAWAALPGRSERAPAQAQDGNLPGGVAAEKVGILLPIALLDELDLDALLGQHEADLPGERGQGIMVQAVHRWHPEGGRSG